MEILNTIFNIINIIWCSLLCFVGGYLMFRSIKPKLNENEIEKEDIKDIKQDWYGWSKGEEPSVEYVYTKACKFERIRIYTKIGFFITGLIIICFGLAAIFEGIK